MSKRRRTATPIFQKPLTLAEVEGTTYLDNKGTIITCRLCHSSGGTLVKAKDTNPVEYECQDKGKCEVMRLRRK